MSGDTAQQNLSNELIGQSGAQAKKLDTLSLTGLQSIMSALGQRFGSNWGNLPGEVSKSFDLVRDETNSAFRQSARGATEAAAYLAKTSGSPISGGEISSIQRQDALGLDQQRRLTLGQIKMDEANAGMTANNGFMRLMTGAGQSALGLASTYQNQALQSASMASNINPWGAAMGGAAAGASAGTALGPWGTLAGGVIGGVGGYMAAG